MCPKLIYKSQLKVEDVIVSYDLCNVPLSSSLKFFATFICCAGEITWTEDKSLCWKLDSEKITLDINTLSYVFVNLVSQETEQRHTFRVVPFIDAILDAKDDVLITVCCCRDIDEEHKVRIVKDFINSSRLN